MVQSQLSTDFSSIQEATRHVCIPTVAGTPGKGKTTFCRRFVEHECLSEFSSDFQAIANNCISSGRQFRVSYTFIEEGECQNPGFSIAVHVL
jgi:GTPase SAR1 family protein